MDPQKYVYQRKPRKKTSAVWKDFKIVEKNSVKKAECHFCKDLWSISRSGSTTHFHRHLISCLPHITTSKRQKILTIDMNGLECVNVVKNFSYYMKKVRELAFHMILYHEYPFSMMEYVISRTTARNNCQSTYEIEIKKPKTILRGVNKVTITTDMWTSGQKISYMVITCHFKCFTDWGIENKVSTITLDNARYNDVALRVLKDVFSLKKKLSIGGQLFHMRCCAYITNLLVKDDLVRLMKLLTMFNKGLVILQNSCNYQARNFFLDVPTRWNNTYLMLVATLEFREVFPRYGDRVQVFNEVTNIISRTEYPTANLFIPEVCRIKEVLNKKSFDQNDYIRVMVVKMNTKFDKYWGECNLLMTVATVLDPRILHELYDEYPEDYNLANVESSGHENARDISSSYSDSINVVWKNMMSGKSMFESFVRMNDTIHPVKSNLDVYLEECVYICNEDLDSHFDTLEWWKVNDLKYCILSKMSCDILSIPITTVASESAFSASGRVIDPYRASISVETVEMLLCGANWVQVLHGLKNHRM
ncbi:hypothetical protein I3760_14G100000 [Carya illinoinensis]|nr:hypothetical protein I3760_14G100000 [Carya illinoinensis]